MANTKPTVKPKDANKPSIFDVAKPGAPAMAPSGNSRSIIIKHQTVQDPMVVAAAGESKKPKAEKLSEEPQTAPAIASPSSKKTVIQPLHDTIEELPHKHEMPTPVPEVVNIEKPVIDDEGESLRRTERINQLVASQELFLPIETSEQRRSKRTAIFGALFIIILLAAWYDVSLDAGLLSNTYNLPHTSFFGNK